MRSPFQYFRIFTFNPGSLILNSWKTLLASSREEWRE